MKIALITDTHYNFKKANKNFHEYFERFYNKIFFPELKKRKISTVIHLGDAFDNRKGIDFWALSWAKENVYNKFQDLGITVYNIVGNHDAYYKNTNQVNAVDTLLDSYYNVIRVSEPKEFLIGDMECVLLPWICSDNQSKTIELLNETKSKIVFGHLELSGFYAYPGHVHTDGMSKDIFNKFDLVFSGHYHTRSDDGRIYYLGNPYQMFWSDVDDTRGFHIFDTETKELEFIKNPYNMFEKIYYEDEDIQEHDFSNYKNKIIKIIVKKKSDQHQLDKFIDMVLMSEPVDLKIIENIQLDDSSFECTDDTIEDTMTLLDKYVEESEFSVDKSIMKKLIREIYKEALVIQ